MNDVVFGLSCLGVGVIGFASGIYGISLGVLVHGVLGIIFGAFLVGVGVASITDE